MLHKKKTHEFKIKMFRICENRASHFSKITENINDRRQKNTSHDMNPSIVITIKIREPFDHILKRCNVR